MTTKNRKRSLPAFVALIGVLLMSSGFAIMATAGSASADQTEGPCVEKPGTPSSYTDWVDEGDLIRTEENVAPGSNTDTVQYIFKGQTEPTVIEDAVPSKWWNWSPNKDQGPFDGPPAFPNDQRGTWQGPHTEGGPAGTGTFQPGNGNADWFHREPGKDAVTDVDYLWQKQTRQFIPATDPVVCPPDDNEPDVATASVTPTDPTCEDPNGSYTTSTTNATISEGEPSGDGVPGGSVNITFVANEGAEFQGEGDPNTRTLTADFADLVAPEGFEIVNGQCVAVEGPPELCPEDSQFPDRPADGSQGPCDEEVSPPPPGGEEPPAAAPPVNNPPAKSPTTTSTTTSTVAGPTTSTPSSTVAGPTIPSTVKAGLGEDVAELAATRTSQGLALVGAGALVMLAGGLGMVRRRGVFARI